EVYRHRLPPSAARRWTEARCDLAAFAGQNVELRLSTETAQATPEEKKPRHAPEPPPDAGADGGAPDTNAVPGTPVALWGNPTAPGGRPGELGVAPERWVLHPQGVAGSYAPDPPLLPLLLRRQGVDTCAFMNNYFIVGYAPVGIEMGFERAADHRYRTRDTLE